VAIGDGLSVEEGTSELDVPATVNVVPATASGGTCRPGTPTETKADRAQRQTSTRALGVCEARHHETSTASSSADGCSSRRMARCSRNRSERAAG
jgi:protein subunit release factor A